MSGHKDELFAALERLAQIEEALADAKALYRERDELTRLLVELSFRAQTWEGRHYELVDNFATANTAYRAAFVRRFEIKITPAK